MIEERAEIDDILCNRRQITIGAIQEGAKRLAPLRCTPAAAIGAPSASKTPPEKREALPASSPAPGSNIALSTTFSSGAPSRMVSRDILRRCARVSSSKPTNAKVSGSSGATHVLDVRETDSMQRFVPFFNVHSAKPSRAHQEVAALSYKRASTVAGHPALK